MTASRAPLFSLIVCTVDRSRELLRLFESLTRQEHRGFEVVLVDQNPPGTLDGLVAAYAGRFKIMHVTSARGLSRARNVGLANATGDFVAFPDDDCWYEPDTLTRAAALFAGSDLDILTGRTLDASGVPSVSPFLAARSAITRDNFLLCGNSNAIFARRPIFGAIGPFDERLGVGAATIFQSGEEADILLRAIAAKFSLTFFPDLVVHHDQVDATITPAQIDRARRYGAGFGALLRKNRFGRFYIGKRLARTLARLGIALVQGDVALARYKFAWFSGTWRGYTSWRATDA